MNGIRTIVLLAAVAGLLGTPQAQGKEEEFQPLFRGLDLSGWRVEPEHREHWAADGKTLARKRSLAGKLRPGPVGLADQGMPVEFANIFIRPLDRPRR